VQALLALARVARDAGAEADGVNRRVLRCPASRQGWILSQFLINGVGRGIGPSVDPRLDGGIPVFVSEIIPLDCGAAPAANLPVTGPGDDPAAALVCGWTRPLHQPLTITRNGQTVTSNSQLLHKYLVVTLGVSPKAAASLITRLEGGNGGDILSVRLDAIGLDSASHPDAVAWLGEARVGVDTYGPKHYRVLQFTADGSTFDLVDQQRGLFGQVFDVGPSQQPVTNCPDFGFTLEDVPALFPDGFASGDVTAWTEASAD